MNETGPASRQWQRVAGIALAAAAVSLARFTPSFVLWRGLGIPEAASDPALNRAGDALMQLRHPFAYVASPNNRVIEWRLFFPVVGHLLALPPWLYLALPHIGCLLALAFIARLLLRAGFGGWEALAAATIAATCSWFFVSADWLAYFDSWYILGLLIAAFAPTWEMLAAILVTPWIDERFVLALPLCLLVRDRYFAASGSPRSAPERWREAALCGAALLPWILVRLGAYAANRDAVSAAYVEGLIPLANGPFYPLGLWHGLRWAWVPVLALPALEWRAGRGRSAALAAGLGLTLAVNLAAANDLSRSVSPVVPALVLGILLIRLRLPRLVRPILFGVCALNLIFPARHVVSNWTEQIFPFPVEIERARHPPPVLDSDYFKYSNGAATNYKLGRLGDALADADRAVLLHPEFPDARYNRGVIRAASGDDAGAAADVAEALRMAPQNWAGREQAEAFLAALRARGAAH